MFVRILIANRGEIACRVIKTCKRLGIETVAVFSEADRNALHVQLADEAHCIGPAPARESYLVVDRILEVAKSSRSEAIHPGYGFLSENPVLSQACLDAGIVFLGPPPEVIRVMGAKDAAKRMAESIDVPVIPGYHGDDQDDATLQNHAQRIGWPCLIKAAAGGGGRGMRRVNDAAEFAQSLAAVRREAKSFFGDDKVIVERFITQPRHIEVQVMGDNFGRYIHLGERDCSIQRRHQKVIEEAPGCGLSDALRSRMRAAALKLASAIEYKGVGTIEFLVDAGRDDEAFYFIEMNTRIQVEHPITEKVFGIDLVEYQFLIAAGEALPPQDRFNASGYAIEARICAEDPSRGYRPTPGLLREFSVPQLSEHLRVDTGFRSGDEISPWYDSLVAKVIVYGESREDAVRKMSDTLARCRINGISSNIPLLISIMENAVYQRTAVDTNFLQTYGDELLTPRQAALG
ncbi:MAG: ATP-grasp domain-containing protein [Alphaproteobacteria bacterium]|nr:ATP-grasp domain-containing protein [Alphaproteobacteria bacterium]